MKSRRSASVTKAVQSASDISDQTKKMFENAGNEVPPIKIKSLNDATREIEYLAANIEENVEWNDQVDAMRRGLGLINGGALEYDVFLKGLNKIYPGLVVAATNLRSALVKQSCLFIAQIAREVGPSIDVIGDFITPLSSQLSHGTQFIAESCKLAILCVAKYCYTRKVLKSIFEISNKRGASVKSVAAEALFNALLFWPDDLVNQNSSQIEQFLQKLLSDASVNARAFARQAVKAYQINFPQKAASFISKLDQRTQKSIADTILTQKINNNNNQNGPHNNNYNNNYQESDQWKSSRAGNRNSQNKNPEKTDIAANPPRMIRPKKSEEDEYQNYYGSENNVNNVNVIVNNNNFKSAYDPTVKRRRNPSVNTSNRRRFSTDSIGQNYNNESSPINRKKRYSLNDEDPNIRKKRNNDYEQNYNEDNNQVAPHIRSKYPSSKYENEPESDNNFTEIQVPSSRYRSKYMQNQQQAPAYIQPQQQMANQRNQYYHEDMEQFDHQRSNPIRQSKADNLGRQRGVNDRFQTAQESSIPKVRQSRRQASVQPVRRNDSKRNSFRDTKENEYGYKPNSSQRSSENMSERMSDRYIEKIVERKKPIQLIEGDEKNYLNVLQGYVDLGNISELASSMTYITRDLIACCSNELANISCQALSILLALIPIYAPHFRTILPSLVETVLAQAENGNPRSSNTAKQILSELHRSFDSNTLLLICTTQPPSVSLLNFTDSIVSLNDVDIRNETICQKLLTLAFKCYNIGSISNRRTAARIIERVNNVNSQALMRFTDSLRDQQLRQFDEFIRPYLPEIQLRPLITEVPRYSSRNAKSWAHKIDHFVAATTGPDWIEIRPALYTELLEALKDKKETEAILTIIYKIFSTRNVEDFNILLPGLLMNIRGHYSKFVEPIMSILLNECDPAEVFASLQPVITGPDADISKAALGFQTLLISKINIDEMKTIIPSLIPGLTKSFESQIPDIRKAVVLCFVELYVRFDKEYMDRHTSHLSKGQMKLIGIYLNRRNKVV